MREIVVRDEAAGDAAGIRAVHAAAFGRAAEADLVDRLRQEAEPLVSLVAALEGRIVGHILFGPVTLHAARVMGLAPMAVLPDLQRRGIGSALVRAGLEQCRLIGADAVVVLGHPAYYPRFGFLPAERFGLRSPYDVPAEAFLALELRAGSLRKGTIACHPAFASLDDA